MKAHNELPHLNLQCLSLDFDFGALCDELENCSVLFYGFPRTKVFTSNC